MTECSQMDEETNFNFYAGSQCGVLKGIYIGKLENAPILKNFYSFTEEAKSTKSDVVSLTWNVEEPFKELLVGLNNNTVKVYNTKLRAFTHGVSHVLKPEHGQLVSVYSCGSNFLFGTNKGKLVLWNSSEDNIDLELSTGGSHLAKLAHCPSDRNLFATGGKENELQLWNLQSDKPNVPLFKARNLPHDELDLRIPVWVQDITFLSSSTDMLAISSRYGHVRLYDTRVNNRPIVNMKYLDHPLIAISTASSNDRHVLVGSGQGVLGLVDLRKVNGELVRQYRGYAGGIKSIYAHPTLPYFASCGLDRNFFLHDINDGKPKKKLYLKSRLNCVVMSDKLVKSQDDISKPEITCNMQNIDMEIITHLTPKKVKKNKVIKACSTSSEAKFKNESPISESPLVKKRRKCSS